MTHCNENAFPCTQCGLCCQRVNLAQETRYLDRGDGTCRHYDPESKGCRIYHQRPAICRVDLQYQLNYIHLYSWEEFVALNLSVCRQLNNEKG
ncbi:YkgJ family cysteine cluster protein [Brenneria sp. KBI 447]|uniref:YkgJ family cysteine cluster protein n=2 Tax=Brenneria izbisi TaxID=2939450 RepID=A0AA41Y497_9GAMM|nr:YkgJ family cysteine cluster protein [Brenneria izbisi]MCV9880422.1 YkgJ family cysteine cluster protein [Brenneria izbisi]MCV9883750.1 YkgJ family cysteine cluster protein [Brenneria izbisi]